MLIFLRLKEICSYKLVLLILLAAPVLFGYLGAYTHNNNALRLKIALLDEDGGEFSQQFTMLLEEAGTELVTVKTKNEGETLLKKRTVEGLAVILSGFEAGLAERKSNLIEYKAATGVRSTELITENLSMAVLNLRSFMMLKSSVSKLELTDDEINTVFNMNSRDVPILEIVSTGGDFSGIANNIPPFHGTAALFMTLPALFTPLWLAQGRTMAKANGGHAALKHYYSTIISLLVICLLQLAVYYLSLLLLFGNSELTATSALGAMMFYCVGLGALLARLSRDDRSPIYIFPAFFLLNMTVGGGLWGITAGVLPVKLFAPVAMFFDASSGDTRALAIMLVLAVIMIGASVPGIKEINKQSVKSKSP